MGGKPNPTKRLVIIRLLLGRAEEQARMPQPFASDAINRLHDVAEMFLALAAQHNHVGIPGKFIDYWKALEVPLGRPLGYKAQMQTLNKVRVNLKHYGVQPAEIEIQDSVAAVRGLLFNECQDLLGVDLQDVALRDLVTCDAARDCLAEAEQQWASGDQTRCFGEIRKAFDAVVNDYTRRKQFWPGHSVFDNLTSINLRSSFSRRVGGERGRFDDDVIKSLKALDKQVQLLGLGVDLRRYGRFRTLVPHVAYVMSGPPHISEWREATRTEDDYKFCTTFVIDTAIHLAEMDYDFDHYAERKTKAEPA